MYDVAQPNTLYDFKDVTIELRLDHRTSENPSAGEDDFEGEEDDDYPII